MTDLVSDTPDQIDQLIKKGHSIHILEKIQSVISAKETSSETRLVYQLLKCRALSSINRHVEALDLLDEIKDEIFSIGSDVQQLDYYICKAYNFEVLSKAKEALDLLEEAEQILQKSPIKDTNEMLQRKIDLFIQRMIIITATKRYFEFYHPEGFDEIIESFDQCITLSHELNYQYGIGISWEQKGFFLFYEGRNAEALECYEKAHKIWKRDDNKGGKARTLMREGMVHAFAGDHSLSIDLLKEALIISEELETKRLSASTHFNLDVAYSYKGDTKLSLKHSKIACDLFREIGDKTISAIALQNYASKIIYGEMEYEKGVSLLYEALSYAKEAESRRTINNIHLGLSSAFLFKGELNRALNFLDGVIEYAEKKADNEGLSFAYSQKGYINLKKGDLDKALEIYLDSLENFKIRESRAGIRGSFIDIGRIFQMKGDYEKALEYFFDAKEISESLKNKLMLASDYYILISCYLAMEDIEKAATYLQSLQEIDGELEDKVLKITTKLSTALILKRSENANDRAKAKEFLKDIINEKDVEYHILEVTILNLCDLLLLELKISENYEILEELKFLINKLQQKGIRELTYPLLVQTYWLQSQISLLELNVDEAQSLFTKAQTMAEEKDLELMARKISAEHDFLIGQLDLWKKFTTKLPSIQEIFELTRIEDMLSLMLKKGVVLPSEVEKEDEKPVIILIFAESGEILFSEKLQDTLEDDILERILPQMKTQIEEVTDYKTAQRGRLYDYSYLLRKVDTLFFCYFFVGKSYSAIQKLEKFSGVLHESSTIWERLITFTQSGSNLNYEERNFIASSIDNIFFQYK
jgi:tetratricopeptide (TPR) repeat protein